MCKIIICSVKYLTSSGICSLPDYNQFSTLSWRACLLSILSVNAQIWFKCVQGGQPGSGGPSREQQEEMRKKQEEMKNNILVQVLDQQARARCKNLNLFLVLTHDLYPDKNEDLHLIYNLGLCKLTKLILLCFNGDHWDSFLGWLIFTFLSYKQFVEIVWIWNICWWW